MPKLAKVFLLIALAAVAVMLARWISKDRLLATLEWIRALGWRGYVAFIVIYILACLSGIPATPLSLAAPIIFDFWPAFLAVWGGATVGASGAFLCGRYLARDWIAARLQKYPRLSDLDERVGRGGWKLALLLRLTPGLPFNAMNYAFGLTKISFVGNASATALGIIPGALVHIYIGKILGDLALLK